MKKFFRNISRVWRGGITKSLRMMHIFLPLTLFFAIIISFCGAFFFGYGVGNEIIRNFESKLNIVVYFDRRADKVDIDNIVQNIQANPEVSQIEFISPDQALEAFKDKHANEPKVLDALEETGDNPFGASVVVFAKDPTSYESIDESIKKLNDNYEDKDTKPIEDISYENHKVAIDRFGNMLKKGEVIFSIVLIIVSIVLLFIVYLALRFATQGDRDEIKVMKLVGAPNMLMVGPTTVMGVASGVLGGILSLFILYFLAREMTPYTLPFANFNLILWYLKNLLYFIVFNLGFGVVIGFCGSLLAIRRHL